MTESSKHKNSTGIPLKRPRIRLRGEAAPPPEFDQKINTVKIVLNVVLVLACVLFVAIGLAPIEEHYNAKGIVRPDSAQNLLASVPVELREPPLVEVGQYVKAGETLMRFSLPTQEQELLNMKTDLENLKSELAAQRSKTQRLQKLPLPKEFWEIEEQVQESRNRMEFHRVQLQRSEKLAESGITSEIDAEKNELAYQQAKIEYERLSQRLSMAEGYAEALLNEARAQEKSLETQISGLKTRIENLEAERNRLARLTAQSDGIILDLPHKNTRGRIEAGSVLAYMSIGDKKALEIFGLQKNFDRVRVGQPVRFKSEVYDPLKSGYGKGVVKHISRLRQPASVSQPGTDGERYYSIFVELVDVPYELKLDSTIDARITLRRAPFFKVLFGRE